MIKLALAFFICIVAFKASCSPCLQINHFFSLSASKYTEDEIFELKRHFNSVGFKEIDLYLIEKSLLNHSQKVSQNRIETYLNFVNTLRGNNFSEALAELEFLDQKNDNKIYINQFKKKLQHIPIIYKLYKNQYTKKEFESLYFSCHATTPNPKNEVARELYNKFNPSLSILFTGLSYSHFHWDETKNTRWFDELGYDLLFSIITSQFGSRIQTNRANPQWIKSIQHYFIGRAAGLTDLLLFPIAFPPSEEKIKLRLNHLKNNPDFNAEIENIHEAYDERSQYTQFRTHIINYVRTIIHLKKPLELGNIDWSKLTEADLDRPEVQEILTLAAIQELYKINQGSFISTGEVGLDRFSYGSVLSVGLMPINMLKSSVNYQILCLGQKTPLRAFTQAAIWSAAFTTLNQHLYYIFRKKLINQ
jgi:hypothetical protein